MPFPGPLLLFCLALSSPQTAAAGEPDAARLRASAEALAAWAVETRRPEILASTIETLIETGAGLEPDDPWGVAELMRALRTMPGGDGSPVDTAARGVTRGVTRAEVTLSPGAATGFELVFSAGEPAIVEARLKRGPEAADVDLLVTDMTGAPLARDIGPDTGRQGFGLFVEWVPLGCAATRIELSNVGSAEARLVLLTPPSERTGCAQ